MDDGKQRRKSTEDREAAGKEQHKRMVGNTILSYELKPGDHIYTWQYNGLYSHHGIYVGDGEVIHFTQSANHESGTRTGLGRFTFGSSSSESWSTPCPCPCPRCGDQSKANGVICSCLECFLKGGELFLFEYNVSVWVFLSDVRGGSCTLAASDPPEDVIYRAKFLLQNGFGKYDVLKNNCEDFAIYCKTGLQVIPPVLVGLSGQVTSLIMNASIASNPIFFCVGRLSLDVGRRGDVRKIPVEDLVVHS